MWLNCCNLMRNLNGWGVASYEWVKRVVSWDGIYFWWRCYKLHYWRILRNCHSHLDLQQPPPWSVSNHQYWGKTFYRQKDYNLLKALMMVRSFAFLWWSRIEPEILKVYLYMLPTRDSFQMERGSLCKWKHKFKIAILVSDKIDCLKKIVIKDKGEHSSEIRIKTRILNLATFIQHSIWSTSHSHWIKKLKNWNQKEIKCHYL